jgi:hypothetical protein
VEIFPIKITRPGERVATTYAIVFGIMQAMDDSKRNGGVITIPYDVAWSPVMEAAAKKVRLFSAFLAVPCSLFIGRLLWMSTQAMESNMHIVMGAHDGTNGGFPGINACEKLPDGTRYLVGRPDLPIIVVGATDSRDQLAQWSNFGPCVDLFG